MEKNGQTIKVLGVDGEVIGHTYLKRAKGLVNKCRATFVADSTIRLNKQSPTYNNMEDNKMENFTNITAEQEPEKTQYIYFDSKKWKKHPEASDSIWDRFHIESPFGNQMAEVVSVGTWDWNQPHCQISNGLMQLEKNTEYHFLFWLNGGENDRGDEVCQLQIFFTNNGLQVTDAERDNMLCYRLNRGYIKPIKQYRGWELYDIPFQTTEDLFTQMRFVTYRAPMAIMAANAPDYYEELQDVLDEFHEERPQRHNIFFEDGWPHSGWYSTKELSGSDSEDDSNSRFGFKGMPNFSFDQSKGRTNFKMDNSTIHGFAENVSKQIMKEINIDEIRKQVIDAVKKDLHS